MRLKNLANYIKSDPFLKNNAIFFVGSLFIAFLNYLYYPIMSRIMTVEEFGEIQTIFSLVFLSGVILTVFRMIVLHITTNSAEQNCKSNTEQPSAAPSPLSTFNFPLLTNSDSIPALFTAALYIHIPFIAVLFFASPLISRFFSFQTSWDFSIFAFFILLSVYLTFYTAYIHGMNAYNTLTISQIIGAAGKLILSFLLVSLGFGVSGAVGALVLVSLITIIYFKKKSPSLVLVRVPLHQILSVLKRESTYGLLVFISLGFITLLYSADVLIVKRLFSPEVAGLYSGIATIARIIFFLTGSISGVLLSSITVEDAKKTNKRSLKKAVYLILLIGGATLLFFSLFPTLTISLLVGAKYASYAHLLPVMSLYLFLVSILNLFVSYLLAIRSYALFPISVIGIITLLVAFFFHHDSPGAIITVFTMSTLTALILSVLAIWKGKL